MPGFDANALAIISRCLCPPENPPVFVSEISVSYPSGSFMIVSSRSALTAASLASSRLSGLLQKAMLE